MKETIKIPVIINQVIYKKRHNKKPLKLRVVGFKITEEGCKVHLKYKDEFGDLSIARVPLSDIYELYYDENTKIKDIQNNNYKTKIMLEDKNMIL